MREQSSEQRASSNIREVDPPPVQTHQFAPNSGPQSSLTASIA
jgi:hypothetical protein